MRKGGWCELVWALCFFGRGGGGEEEDEAYDEDAEAEDSEEHDFSEGKRG